MNSLCETYLKKRADAEIVARSTKHFVPNLRHCTLILQPGPQRPQSLLIKVDIYREDLYLCAIDWLEKWIERHQHGHERGRNT